MTEENNLREISDIFTKEENNHLNRNSFFDVDWNRDYKNTIENILRKTGLSCIPPELEDQWQSFLQKYTEGYKRQKEIMANNPSPAITGRSKFNYRRSDKLMARERKMSELSDKLVAGFNKKVRSYHFQQSKFGPTAEQRHQIKREELDKVIAVGMTVEDGIFGEAKVLKINKKTYTLRFNSGHSFTRDKIFIKPIEQANEQLHTENKVLAEIQAIRIQSSEQEKEQINHSRDERQ